MFQHTGLIFSPTVTAINRTKIFMVTVIVNFKDYFHNFKWFFVSHFSFPFNLLTLHHLRYAVGNGFHSVNRFAVVKLPQSVL